MRTDFYFRYRLYRRLGILAFVDTLGPKLCLVKRTPLGQLLRIGRHGVIILGIP